MRKKDCYTGYVEDINASSPKLVINGGTFDGGLNTIKNDDNAVLEINDGLFTNNIQVAVMNWNIATINGGTFNVPTGNDKTSIFNGYSSTNVVNENYINSGQLTITGGTFKAEYALEGSVNPDDKLTITAGNFDLSKGFFNPDKSYNSLTNNGTTITGGFYTIDPTDLKETGYVIIDGTTVNNVEYKYQIAKTYNKLVSDKDKTLSTEVVEYKKDANTDLVIVFNGQASNFTELVIDGKVVPKNMYTVKQGSTIITLKAEFLNNITTGDHKVKAIYNDGEVVTSLKIADAVTTPVKETIENPQTYDNGIELISMLVISVIAIISSIIILRKRNN